MNGNFIYWLILFRIMLWELCFFVFVVIWGVFDFGVGECVNGGVFFDAFIGVFLIVICKLGKLSYFFYFNKFLGFKFM